MMEYIDENLNRIMQNPDSVLYLRPYAVGNKGNKRALFAMVREEQGVYRKVQITKEESKMTFPFEPICRLYNGPGYFYLNNFIVLNSNTFALNTTNLDGFKAKPLVGDKTGVFATFSDGSATFVWRERPKKFEKKGGIQPYIDLLKKYKEYEPKHDTYKYIEGFDEVDGLFVIPELQTKIEEQPMVKKLIPNTRKDD